MTIDKQKIRQLPLFAVLDDDQFDQIARTTHSVTLTEGETLFTQGQQAERFYLVVEGTVKLYLLSKDGNEKIVEIMDSGALFAEAVMFMEHGRYPVNASALESSTLYSFHNHTLMSMLRDSNELCLRLLANVCKRLHAELREIDNLSLQNGTFRVVGYLLDLLPDAQAKSTVIELNAPKLVIASRLSITPETFSRILSNMAKHGILKIHGRTLDIKSVQQLREFGRYDKITPSNRR